MFNAVRMDIYRLIHTKSAYVILVIAMALAIAMSGMTALIRSMAADSIVETNEQVNMVSESDSEITGEYDTASAEASNGPTATVGLEVDDSDMSDEIPTIADMVESDIAGLDLALLLAIFTVLFSTADLNSGYIKSVGGQVKSRGVLLFSKMIALSVFTFVAMALDVIVQCIATPLFLHGAEFGDAADLFKMLGSQYVVTLLFVYFVMAMAIIIKNNVISMIIAVCMCTGIFTLIFSGINILIEKIGVKNFDINDYLIVNKISELDLSASVKTVGGAFAVAVLIAVLLKIRAQLRDINEQLDFLCEKDTNMLLLTDTNMADIGRLKERINRFLEQWHRQREAAAKKEQMISDTYTNLSHDIRTPLTSLDGYFQLLRDETDKSAQEHYIDIIQERITSLKDMLEELFMFTKLKNDSFKLELSNCCVSRLLKQTVFSYYEEWKKQGIEPSLDICEDTIFITANVQALRRVFQNVIKNALVHGQKSICIQMRQQDSCNCRASDDERTSKNRIVHILVSNDVKNPDDIDVDKVFERFYKADEARSISSSGLGLSIAKELVERMGGSIEARLEGKRFVVEILFECE